MTDPLDDAAVVAHERGFRRELIGLLCVLLGLLIVFGMLATVDWRLVLGTGGVVLIATGLYLGRGDGGEA